MSRAPAVHDVTLEVAGGEIVGLFGLVGSGRSELLETIFGLHRAASGEVRVGDALVEGGSIHHATRAGIALVPEDRQRQALFFNLALRHNLVLPRATTTGARVMHTRRGTRLQQRAVAELEHQGAGHRRDTGSLSGGNQQKVVLARWLAINPRVLPSG